MANNAKTCVAIRNAALDGFDVLNSGKFRTYDGLQPTDSDTALGSQVLLADEALSATAFAAASSGSKTANSVADDSDANAGGTAGWCTLATSGNVRKMDMSAATSGADATFNSLSIAIHAKVSCSSLVISQAA